jgi:hypothetical protein
MTASPKIFETPWQWRQMATEDGDKWRQKNETGLPLLLTRRSTSKRDFLASSPYLQQVCHHREQSTMVANEMLTKDVWCIKVITSSNVMSSCIL